MQAAPHTVGVGRQVGPLQGAQCAPTWECTQGHTDEKAERLGEKGAQGTKGGLREAREQDSLCLSILLVM